eukprot:NODE_12894_length_173_cov_27.983871_g12811_i0.p2 GENE.NODE_12894_length_173_cov_27.983871_g12811_i0~~NODE_12894_length_173_cov_27.983871_g12811_i0.p2  ORF type:complete len:50 (+),score=18.61 NODE_12894_length_173_cov_27.983871_g12811_i0:30-152(+)
MGGFLLASLGDCSYGHSVHLWGCWTHVSCGMIWDRSPNFV